MGDASARGQGEDLNWLLSEMRRQTAQGAEPDARKVLDWLHRQTGVEVALVGNDAATVAARTAGFPQEAVHSLAPLLARMSGGQLAAATTQVEGWHVHCEALGTHDPRQVLVAAGCSEPTRRAVSLTSHACTALAMLRRVENGDRAWRGYQHKAHQVRFAVLHALLAGEPMLARRMTTGAVPPLLDTERLRVHLLRCPPADRARITRTYQDHLGYHGSDLLVQCPVFTDHLICLIADGEERHAETVRLLVRDNPRYALGISDAHPLSATAAAYAQSAHALAAARTVPHRVAFYHGQTPLQDVLVQPHAAAWARALLRPLDSVPKTSTDIIRLVMLMPRSGVARLLGLSRNTITAHLKRAEQALGHSLADARFRAAIHLALALSSSQASAGTGEHPPTLAELLSIEPAAAWAHTVLRPLDSQHRCTLRTWIETNTDAQQAAQRLGLSRNTVRAHLRTAEALLGLDLLTTGAGVHDVVHALDIVTARTP